MYRKSTLRVQCVKCAVELPIDQTELTADGGGYECWGCKYGKHRAPMVVTCGGCKRELPTGEASIASFGTGYLCSVCAARVSIVVAERRALVERRERRALTTYVLAGGAIAILASLAALFGF
ncbi:MAG TPA: hypothetical protein VFF06_35825 [Polyangia bacterium]|nr:hypothetical protein [Polyangia bacterium]